MSPRENYLSFDVEEYFHGPAYDHIEPARWPHLPRRLPANMQTLLSILGGRHRATFFFVGAVAEEYPEIVKELHRAGHEIGCHSHMHRNIWDQTPAQFREDVTRAKDTIEGVIGERIIGYRAPTFSIRRDTAWALDILHEVGFAYDSSVFPIRHDRYGIPEAPRAPYRLPNGLLEIPLSTVRVLGQNIPFGGGGYLRVYPYWTTAMLIWLRHRGGHPFVMYQHPWELDRTHVPPPKSFVARARRRIMIGRPEDKLTKLLARHRFVPLRAALKAA